MGRRGWMLTGTAAAMALLSEVALAGPELVSFPAGYKEAFTHFSSRDRDNPEQVAELYANDIALASARDGAPLDHGSVLVMEIYKAKLDEKGQPLTGADGRRVKDSLAVIAVMEKQPGWGAEYPEDMRNGEWEYAFFSPGEHALVEREYASCFGCHKPLTEQDFVFSIDELHR